MPTPTRTGQASDGGQSDLALVRSVLAGDSASMDRFVRRMGCIPRILRALGRRTGRPLPQADLDDLAQDVLTVLWRKLEQFDGRSALEAWTYRFCFLEFLKFQRGRASEREVDAVVAEPALGTGVGSDLEAREDLGRILVALERLPAMDADAIRMRRLEDLSFSEIADRVGVPEATAKSRYYRGIRELRRLLVKSAGGPEE